MSVRKGERGKTKLKVLTLCMNLALYSAEKTSKDKFFPKSARWMFPKRIMDECLDAVQCISFANSIFVQDRVTASIRISKEKEAHAHLQSMITLVDLAYNMYPSLTDRAVEYWTGLIVETDTALKEWIEYDKKRFEKMPYYIG